MHLAVKERYKDYCGALILLVLGLATWSQSGAYRIGTLNHMGPGFVPAALGVILAVVGVVMLVMTAFKRSDAPVAPAIAVPTAEVPATQAAEWRGWICICLGVIAFGVLAERTGLIPATIACVFISAMGDRENSWRDALILAVCIAIAAVGVFWWGLSVLLPLYTWNFG